MKKDQKEIPPWNDKSIWKTNKKNNKKGRNIDESNSDCECQNQHLVLKP